MGSQRPKYPQYKSVKEGKNTQLEGNVVIPASGLLMFVLGVRAEQQHLTY